MRYTITYLFFFFSSRRRHTRCSRDWSSDVCSSDLFAVTRAGENEAASGDDWVHLWEVGTCIDDAPSRKLGDFTQGDLPANFTGIEVIRGQSSPGRRNHREATVCKHKSKDRKSVV